MPKTKPEVFPSVTVDHDENKFHIEIELPGSEKKDIELDVGDRSFCIKAPTEEIVYSACYTLAHEVDPKKAEATFNNGLLKISLPFKSKLGGTRILVK
ncbi:MAG: Hsp20/alpha crystallin family protein [Nitrososphaeria archaeon]